jgi:hypothetical protein
MKHYLLVSLLLGCTQPLDLEEVEQAGGCSDIWCGMNSSKLGAIYTHYFRTDGQPTDDGFTITHVTTATGLPASLRVVEGEFELWAGKAGRFRGAQVNGARIFISHDSGLQFVIGIERATTTSYWANTAALHWTYELLWSPVVDGDYKVFENVCTNPPVSRWDAMGMETYTSLVFEGDQINGGSKTVSGYTDRSVFNIGCAGHALAKMALTGHTYSAAANAGLVTTPSQRQTFLKMITGDYAGDGSPFTVPGTQLDWTSSLGWLPYARPSGTLEARWSPSGAVCLDTPRLVAQGNPTGNGEFPDGVEAALTAHFTWLGRNRPPPCNATDRKELAGMYMASANPPML